MYRYCIDDAVTYTPDDFVLFRESPFAVWMERLTLENPTHGIEPDEAHPPQSSALPQEAIVDTLRAEGRDVALVEWGFDEPERRARTLAAMRDGADFIVDGQLAHGDLSGTANLLMRTSGFSHLGDFLYIPCDTQAKTTLNSAFRLCFLADLLQGVQGQLPPQMLVIRGDADVVPLHTEDHIYYYLAVKKRFVDAMRAFRQHQLPDPSESAHFGRWGACASDVMKRRALKDEDETQIGEQESGQENQQEVEQVAVPELKVAAAGGAVYDTDLRSVAPDADISALANGAELRQFNLDGAAAGQTTLAEQARMLDPGSYHVETGPGRTPNLAHFKPAGDRLETVADTPALPEESLELELVADTAEDMTLQNLSFIGSGSLSSSYEVDSRLDVSDWGAPVANLGLTPVAANVQSDATEVSAEQAPEPVIEKAPEPVIEKAAEPAAEKVPEPASERLAAILPDLEPPEPFLLPPEDVVVGVAPRRPGKAHPLDSTGNSDSDKAPLLDLDGVPPPGLAPLPAVASLDNAEVGHLNREISRSEAPRRPENTLSLAGADSDDIAPLKPAFSDSLITNTELEEP